MLRKQRRGRRDGGREQDGGRRKEARRKGEKQGRRGVTHISWIMPLPLPSPFLDKRGPATVVTLPHRKGQTDASLNQAGTASGMPKSCMYFYWLVPQTTPARNKYTQKFRLFVNPKPLNHLHLLLVILRVTSQIKNSWKCSFNLRGCHSRCLAVLWGNGSFEVMACGAFLGWGKGDRKCWEQKELIKQYLYLCYLSSPFL